MIGAVVILIKYGVTCIFASAQPLPREVLSNAEPYLRAINLTLICLISVSDFLAGLLIYAKQKSLLNAGVFQLTPFLSTTLLESSWRVAPEPLQIVTAICIAMLLIPMVTNEEYCVSTTARSIMLGALIGFGIATKVTFFPFILLILLCGNPKKKICAFASCICSTLFFTLPILPYYERSGKWFLRLALRNGPYGRGQVGIPEMGLFWSNLQSLFWREPYFLAFVGSLLVLLFLIILGRTGKAEFISGKKYRRLIFVFSSIIALQLLITLKHYRIHYMTPSFSTLGFVCFTAISVVDKNVLSERRVNAIKFILSILLVACVATSIMRSVDSAQSLKNSWIEAEEIEDLISSSYGDYTLVGFYRSSSIPYALAFGNDFSCKYCGDILADIYPKMSFYHIWGQSFYDYTREFEPHEIYRNLKDGKRILMQGTYSLEEWGMLDQHPFLEMETVYSGSESLYEIKLIAGGEQSISQHLNEISFTGWHGATGLAVKEGPYPQSQLPVVRWGLGPRTELRFYSTGEPLSLSMICGTINLLEWQELTILLNGEQIYQEKLGGEFRSIGITLLPQIGENDLILAYEDWDKADPNLPRALLYKQLRITSPLTEEPLIRE
jgi:hypothetical protein